MSFSVDKVDGILCELEKKQSRFFETKDLEGLISFYHPDAVLIQKGIGVSYGRDGNPIGFDAKYLFNLDIKKAMASFMGTNQAEVPGTEKASAPITRQYGNASFDGEYIIQRGSFRLGDNPNDHPFEQIYKNHNGEYLLYYDSFEFIP